MKFESTRTQVLPVERVVGCASVMVVWLPFNSSFRARSLSGGFPLTGTEEGNPSLSSRPGRLVALHLISSHSFRISNKVQLPGIKSKQRFGDGCHGGGQTCV